MPSVLRHPKPVVVVPSAIDLSRFPVPTRRPRQPGMLRLVYSGSVGGRYHMEGTGRFAVAARGQAGSVHLRILTRAARATVAEQLAASGLKPDEWSCEALAPADVPAELARHHAGIHLPRPGIASHGGSPTKIGEYWASGLPVVVSRGIGDIDEITGRMEVGIVVADLAEDALRAAARGLDHLLGDNDLRGRCRRAAEEHYSLERAVADQRALYDRFAPKMNDDARQ